MSKIRWTTEERRLIIDQIQRDRVTVESNCSLGRDVVIDFTDTYMDYVQERVLSSRRWIDWRDGQSINPDIAACFGKSYAIRVKVTRPVPKVILNLESEIKEGMAKAEREHKIHGALMRIYGLADRARTGDDKALAELDRIVSGKPLEVVSTLDQTPSQDQTPSSPIISEDDTDNSLETPDDIQSGPSQSTIALREIAAKRLKFVIIGAMNKHRSQVESALRGNEKHIDIVWQPRCRQWRESMGGEVSAVMMSNLCDSTASNACKQYCKVNNIPFEPSGTGKTAIIAWISRYAACGLRIDGNWYEPSDKGSLALR